MAKRRPKPRPQPTPPPQPDGGGQRIAILLGAAAVIGAVVWALWPAGEERPSAPAETPTRLMAGSPEYVDDATCSGCHQDIAATYAETGMGRSFYRATPEAMAHLGDERTLRHELSGRSYAIREEAGRFYLRREEIAGGGAFEKEIHYVMGSGNHARSYLHQYPNGKLVELPVGWYAEQGGGLGMSPGFDQEAHGGFRREIGFECFSCHNSYPAIEPGADAPGADPLFPGRLVEGVGCQRCHGPGRAHVEAVAAGESPQSAIFNPATVGRERQLEVCMQCHLESTSRRLPYSIVRFDRGRFSYRPSEPLEDFVLHFDHPEGVREDKFEIAHAAYRLRDSACFLASEMTCTTCHDPHQAFRGAEATARYSAACKECHQGAEAEHLAAGRRAAAEGCIDCHMPKRRTEDVVRVVMTDHRIMRRPPAGDALAALAETREEGDALYQGEVIPYYPEQAPELYVATAQVYEQTNLEAGIPRLRALIEEKQPAEAGFYFQLAEAYWHAGRTAESLGWYEQALERDPGHAAATRNYALALGREGRPAEARTLLERRLAANPRDARAWTNLGDVLLAEGSAEAARTALEKALEIDSDSPEARHNLARVRETLGDREGALRQAREALRIEPRFAPARNTVGKLELDAGELGAAEATLRRALADDPGYAEARYNLASVLIAREEYQAAERELRRTVADQPALAPAQMNLGNLLAARGDVAGAEQAFRRSIAADPRMAEAHFNLGNALMEQRRFDDARTAFEQALAVESGYDPARLNLAVALAQTGDRAGALAQLERLASSADARVREAAEGLRGQLQ